MLRIPAVRQLDDLTVHQDDAIWTRFYLVPSLPSIRRDKNERPIFLLSIIHTSDQQRETTPGTPRGGGFMNFDVQFAVDNAAREKAVQEMQRWVDEEYARRRTDPQYKNLQEYAGPTAPKIEIADPMLSGGTVSMHTTQSALLVSGRFSEAPASLVSGSTAVFNLDLTENGAAFMHELFVGSGGSGRVDLTPVQVIYNLKMWARLPRVKITVVGDSERIQSTLQKISQTTRDNVCTPAEIETFRESGTNSAMLKETGMVTVTIDKGDATVPEEALQALQQYALDLFDTMVKERFLVEAKPDGEPLAFDPGDPKLRPGTQGWNNSRYKVRETLNQASMHLEIRIDRSQVVEWPTGGQATLETFFAGESPEEIKRHVVELTADDFDSLGVTVRALVDFDKQPAQAVEVQTEYVGTDPNGQTRTSNGGFTFRAGEVGPSKFDPTILGGKLDYRYRTRVVYDDGSATDFTAWETTTTRELNVTVTDPGGLALEVSGASLNWDVVRGVKAALTYVDPADSRLNTEKTYELTKLNPVRKWEQRFNKPLTGTVKARLTYFLVDDKVVEGDEQTIALTDSLFIVPPPQVDVLNVSLVPVGNWSDVAQVVVLLKYDAGEGRVYDKTFKFTALDQMAEWMVLLRDPNRRSFQYQTLATYKTGGSDQSAWITKTGDQAIPIEVKGVPRLKVNVLSNLVDFTRTPVVKVSLAYGNERKTLSFTASGTSSFDVPLNADGSRDYAYEITWLPANGDPVTSGLQRTSDTELFIPRAKLPVTGELDIVVRGFAVDFAATPFVDVALNWIDGDRTERKAIVLSADAKNATCTFNIGDRTQRKYHYAITYNRADGSRVPGAQGDTDDPVVSVTRFQP